MTHAKPAPPIGWSVKLDPFLILSALIALAYAIAGPSLFAQDAPPLFWLAMFKAAPVFLLAVRAALGGSRLLTLGLLAGCAGDALLVWPETFLNGAIAFLLGHVCYIALFVRAGAGRRATLRQPLRILAMLAIAGAALVMTSALVPHDTPLYVPLGLYTGVLAIMTMSSFTLPSSRWLVMAGAVLFFISDGFVAWNMFHPDADPMLAFWRSFAGWMIYWIGQAAICYGALGLHRTTANAAA